MMKDQTRLLEAVTALERELTAARFPLKVDTGEAARITRDELVGQIEDYLLPRLRAIDAPLLAVVGGSTGAGKSTLVNSIVRRAVSESGVLRPTTTTPVLVGHPDDQHWFEDDRVLPGLARVTGARSKDPNVLNLVWDQDVPKGIALLDAPDIDSVVQANRQLASQLLAAADLWLFVTTASRYSDAVPWDFLRKARARSTALAIVLNRVPEEALEEVPGHLAEMLKQEGLDAPILTVLERPLEDGLIPEEALGPVAGWLSSLASDAEARAEVIRQTLQGTLVSLDERTGSVVVALEEQISKADELARRAEQIHADALVEIDKGLGSGALLRGEVIARWHEFVGTGDFMRNLQTGIGRFRDRVNELFTGQPPVTTEVQNEVERNIEAVVKAAIDKAAEKVVAEWRSSPAGRSLWDENPAPATGKGLASAIDTEVREWQAGVLELVRAQGASKRAAGRFVSLGVNGVGAALMIAVFAHTGGLTGGEVVIAGSTAALSQRLLEAMFGDEAVRELTAKARRDLLRRIGKLVDAERARFVDIARHGAPAQADVQKLRAALNNVQTAS